jgi:hypothetical protein
VGFEAFAAGLPGGDADLKDFDARAVSAPDSHIFADWPAFFRVGRCPAGPTLSLTFILSQDDDDDEDYVFDPNDFDAADESEWDQGQSFAFRLLLDTLVPRVHRERERVAATFFFAARVFFQKNK